MSSLKPMAQPMHFKRQSPVRAQRGVATLVVVMVLLFVVSLVAAYASRNLIFEQRTSANQYRATQSAEAAEAGIEWALTMLNGGRIDTNCQPTTDTAFGNFRDRYLSRDATNGVVTPKLISPAPVGAPAELWVACTFDGANWQCACPSNAPLTSSSLPDAGPAFAVRFSPLLVPPGIVRIDVNGCSSYDLNCLRRVDTILSETKCRTLVCALFAVSSGAKMPPAAAVTARGEIGGASLAAVNEAPSSGLTLHSGGAISLAAEFLTGLPGTPPALTKRPDDAEGLGALPAYSDDCAHCLFASVFGLRPASYRAQQALVEIDCSTACSAADVNAALGVARGRIVWLRNAGGLTIGGASDVIGSAADPAVLVIDGPLTISAGASLSAKIHGLVYAAAANIDSGEVRGALVSGGDVTANGTALVTYDADILRRLRFTTGSFVRIPGSWRDFP